MNYSHPKRPRLDNTNHPRLSKYLNKMYGAYYFNSEPCISCYLERQGNRNPNQLGSNMEYNNWKGWRKARPRNITTLIMKSFSVWRSYSLFHAEKGFQIIQRDKNRATSGEPGEMSKDDPFEI